MGFHATDAANVIEELRRRIVQCHLDAAKGKRVNTQSMRQDLEALRNHMMGIINANPDLRGRVTLLSLLWQDLSRDASSAGGAFGNNISDRKCVTRQVRRCPETNKVLEATQWLPVHVMALSDNTRDTTVTVPASACQVMTRNAELEDARIVNINTLLGPEMLCERFGCRGVETGSDLRVDRVMCAYTLAIVPVAPAPGWESELAVEHYTYHTYDARNPKNVLFTMTPLTSSLHLELPRSYSDPQRLHHTLKNEDTGILHEFANRIEFTNRAMNTAEVGTETEEEKELKRERGEVTSEKLFAQETPTSCILATMSIELAPPPPPPPPKPVHQPLLRAATTRSLGASEPVLRSMHSTDEDMDDDSPKYCSLKASTTEDPDSYRACSANAADDTAGDAVYRGAEGHNTAAPAPAPMDVSGVVDCTSFPATSHAEGTLFEAGVGLGSELGPAKPLLRTKLTTGNRLGRLDMTMAAVGRPGEVLSEESLVNGFHLMRKMFSEAAAKHGQVCLDRTSAEAVALGISTNSSAGPPAPPVAPPPSATPAVTVESMLNPEGFLPKKRLRKAIGMPVTPFNSPAAEPVAI